MCRVGSSICIPRVRSPPFLSTDVWVVLLSISHQLEWSLFLFNFFISLFPFAIEEVGGDDLYICLLSWQKIDEVLQMEEMEQVLWED